VREALEALELMLRMLLCMLEAMRCMLLRMLDVVEGVLSFSVCVWQFFRYMQSATSRSLTLNSEADVVCMIAGQTCFVIVESHLLLHIQLLQ